MKKLLFLFLIAFSVASSIARDGAGRRILNLETIKNEDRKKTTTKPMSNHRLEDISRSILKKNENILQLQQPAHFVFDKPEITFPSSTNWFDLISNSHKQYQNTKQAKNNIIEFLDELGLGRVDQSDIDHRVSFDAIHSLLLLRGKPMVKFFLEAIEYLQCLRDELVEISENLLVEMFEYDFCYFISKNPLDFECGNGNMIAPKLSRVLEPSMSATTTTTTPSPPSLWSSLFGHHHYLSSPFAHVRGNASEPDVIYVGRPPMIG